jgi:ATP-dependent Lhr-like helicase
VLWLQEGSCAVVQDVLLQWFASKGWSPFEFQRRAWKAYRAGASGLVHAPTGMGKSYAVWLGPLAEWLETAGDRAQGIGDRAQGTADRRNNDAGQQGRRQAGRTGTAQARAAETVPLQVLWITPLRALANDTAQTLLAPIESLHLPWTVELRTGDTSASVRKRQRERLPSALVTTPESLCLLLSYPETREAMRHLRCVVVDEWHELLGSKRGVQVELALARLRGWLPDLRTWGLSATLGNLEQAMQVLLGVNGAATGRLIRAESAKRVEVVTLPPPDIERFPWAGHIGIRMLPQVIATIGQARSTLLFTNTRAQAELWFRELMLAQPKWIGQVALHHGSLDRGLREQVEFLLRAGSLRCVVCTSSLDLGVDFPAVDQVIQVGSPKGIGRLLQRAGRSGHQPGAISRIVCVPTHAFELVEYAAVREALAAGQVEPRAPLGKPLDVLAQHVVTIAAGGGFVERELREEVRTTHAYRGLSEDEWRWVMEFVQHGGATLRTYPQYARVVERNGQCVVAAPQIARLHQMSIGTICSESQMNVRMLSGGSLGTLEEGFVAKLREGDCFVFAGKALELVMVHDMTAYVRKAARPKGAVPHWSGSRIPLSAQMARQVRAQLAAAGRMEGTGDRGQGTASNDGHGTRQRQRGGGKEKRSNSYGNDHAPATTQEHGTQPCNGAPAIDPQAANVCSKGPAQAGTTNAAGPANSAGLGSNTAWTPNDGGDDSPATAQGRDHNEMEWVRPVLAVQAAWSCIPQADELLIERTRTREGTHVFVYPFEGRFVHEGLAALVAYRLSREAPRTVSMIANDYGFGLVSVDALDLDESGWRRMLSREGLLEDLHACLNAAQLGRRRFRDIARVAGLVFAGYPGQARSTRHLQASSELFFDVFLEHDPGNLLLEQARREVLETQLELSRLEAALEQIATSRIVRVETPQLTPLAFPIWAEHVHAQVSSEKWIDRVRRMSVRLEKAATAADKVTRWQGDKVKQRQRQRCPQRKRKADRAADPVG